MRATAQKSSRRLATPDRCTSGTSRVIFIAKMMHVGASASASACACACSCAVKVANAPLQKPTSLHGRIRAPKSLSQLEILESGGLNIGFRICIRLGLWSS